jgi:hypothetical protein
MTLFIKGGGAIICWKFGLIKSQTSVKTIDIYGTMDCGSVNITLFLYIAVLVAKSSNERNLPSIQCTFYDSNFGQNH